jgi:murein tripeptide amidase MpaA
MQIESNFECGNIIVESINDQGATLAIRPDSNANYFQWFFFRVEAEANTPQTFVIANAGQSSYPKAWNGYQALASYDGQDWFRVPTTFDGASLIIEHTPAADQTAYAFFVPYYESQRQALLEFCAASRSSSVYSIGTSVQGRSIDLITILSQNPAAKKVWIVTRQHAGEPMAEWATEGLTRRLLDESDPVSQELLTKASFYIIPNANPDGSALGNLRANANGVDLNRAWNEPPATAPEIAAIEAAITQESVDYFLDVHGDEERPFIWLVPPDVPMPPHIREIQGRFVEELAQYNPSIQPPPKSVAGVTSGDLGMSNNYIMAAFGAPGWIIELPFKAIPDGDDPDSVLAEGCWNFGRSCVDALNAIL